MHAGTYVHGIYLKSGAYIQNQVQVEVGVNLLSWLGLSQGVNEGALKSILVRKPVDLAFMLPNMLIVRRSPPRHSSPQSYTTSDVHQPLCKIRRSPPQTFATPDVHHLRRSPPQTFTTPDVHHPLCKIRHSPPQTFTTPADLEKA